MPIIRKKKKGVIFGMSTLWAASMLVSILVLSWIVWHKLQARIESLPEVIKQLQTPSISSSGKVTLKLYFESAQTGELEMEEREFAVTPAKDSSSKRAEPPQLPELAHMALEALSSAPPGNKRLATLPKGVKLRNIYLDAAGTAYADFDEQLAERHPGGTQAEMITIYSVVNTLCANFPQIKRVRFLIGGKEAQTLAGHVDIKQPFNYK